MKLSFLELSTTVSNVICPTATGLLIPDRERTHRGRPAETTKVCTLYMYFAYTIQVTGGL